VRKVFLAILVSPFGEEAVWSGTRIVIGVLVMDLSRAKESEVWCSWIVEVGPTVERAPVLSGLPLFIKVAI